MQSRVAVVVLLASVASLSARGDAQRARDLEVGGAFVLGAAVLAPLDGRVHDVLTQPALVSNVALHRTANTISALILPGTAGILLGTFHGGEAIFLGEVVTGALKIAFGRSRPSRSPDDPYDFHPGHALRHDDQGSLPSAHATAAFALAVWRAFISVSTG